MSPKDKVRGNIYKELLTEEKKKNKKMVVASMSLLVVGILSGSALQNAKNYRDSKVMAALTSKSKMILSKDVDEAKLFMKLPEITIGKLDFIDGISTKKEDNINFEHILNGKMFNESQIRKIDSDDLYGVSDRQI